MTSLAKVTTMQNKNPWFPSVIKKLTPSSNLNFPQVVNVKKEIGFIKLISKGHGCLKSNLNEEDNAGLGFDR